MRLRVLVALSFLFVTACALPRAGQTSLPVETITIDTASGPAQFRVEIAADDASRQQGLMFRKQMAANEGMLFVFDKPEMAIFWMHNTYIPLDMIFVRASGTVSSVAHDVKILSDARTFAEEPVLGVIEINAGRAAALGIKKGDRIHARAFRNAVALP